MTETQSTRAGTAFRAYLPRIAATWGDAPPARVVDGTLLGLDIAGFTALSERLAARGKLGAEELIALISRCYSGLIEIGSRHGGDVLKFRGDALLLFFDGDGHEERAARAALGMQELIAVAGTATSSVGPVQLTIAAGAFSGDCHFFMVGSHHHELIVCGPAASATLALEDAAEAGEVLVSARTANALEGLVGEERDGAYLLRPANDGGDLSLPPVSDEAGDLAMLVPPSLRGPIATNAIEPEHRHATAAFVKLKGTDELVLDLPAAHAALAALAEVVSETTERLEVTWLESDIDRNGAKLYLVAGAPSSPGGDEERMLRAARAIVDEHAGPPIAVGVNRGPVLAGPIGAPERWTYAVMGDTVNLAARLVARAEPGEILGTGDVLQRSRARFHTTSRQFLMKGKERPVTGFSVGALVAVEGLEERASLPLVGREPELAILREAVESARRRECAAVELVGDAGIGKSRLVEELPALALGFQLLQARCEEYAAATPFSPFRTLLRPLIGATPDESPQETGERLSAFVQSVMPDLAPWLPLLALPFDATVASTAEVDEVDESFRRDRLHDAVEQLLSRLLLMPTAIVVEDAHWLDDASQLLLRRLAQPAARPWVVCITRRPSGLQTVGDGAHICELGPLETEAALELAVAATEGDAVSAERLSELAERSGGNPLFIRELALASDGGDELPESIETLLTTRLDTLEAGERLLLRHAAVIGRSFDLDLLAEILPGQETDPDRWLRVADFVTWESDTVLVFRHDLVRAAAYTGLSYSVRREIHGRVGAALERRAGDAAEIAPILSLHFFEAGQFDRAWGYAVAAGRDARAKFANVDAAILFERALNAAAALTSDPVATAAVAEELGDVYELTARYDDAERAYARAAGETRDATTAARLLRKRGVIHERTARYDEARASYEAALAIGDAVAAIELVEIENAIATVLYRQGRIEECVEWCERAVQRARQAADRRGLAQAYYVRAAAEGNRSGPAREFLDLALPIYEEIGDLVRTSLVLSNMGVPAYYAGDWDEALRCYAAGRAMAQRAGHVVGAANATNNEAEVLLDQGRLDEARALLGDALRAYHAAGFAIGEALATLNLGRAAAFDGSFAEASELLQQARDAFDRVGADSFALTARSREAEALVLEGHHARARELATETLAASLAAGERGTLTAQLERLAGYASVQARDPEGARAHFAASLEVARETGALYEEALTLKALADAGLAESTEGDDAAAILARLGVVRLPVIPLP